MEEESQSFDDWMSENGADIELIHLLKSSGFSSKLSLKNIDFQSPDASLFVNQLNYGQTCLLKGLVDMLHNEKTKDDPYSRVASNAASLSASKSTLREKIGKLFHYQPPSKKDEEAEFQPLPAYRKQKSGLKRKGGSVSGKGPLKKKVKQVKTTVVGLRYMSKSTPTGSNRETATRHVWLNVCASEEDIRLKINQAFGWNDMEFLYAQGKNLRQASLCDIENSETWDFETVRALMGSGALYVLKKRQTDSSNDFSDEEASSSNPAHSKPIIHVSWR